MRSLSRPSHVSSRLTVLLFLARTKTRPDTFFGHGLIVHVAMGEPVCPKFRGIVKEALASME